MATKKRKWKHHISSSSSLYSVRKLKLSGSSKAKVETLVSAFRGNWPGDCFHCGQVIIIMIIFIMMGPLWLASDNDTTMRMWINHWMFNPAWRANLVHEKERSLEQNWRKEKALRKTLTLPPRMSWTWPEWVKDIPRKTRTHILDLTKVNWRIAHLRILEFAVDQEKEQFYSIELFSSWFT